MPWTSISQSFSHARVPKESFLSPGKPTYGNVYRPEANRRLVAHGYYYSIANDLTKIPAIFRWLFGIFRSNAKCLYDYYTISLETPDDVFRNPVVPRNPSWETLHEPFFNITSHPLFGFSRGLLVSASTFLTEVDALPIFFICAVCLSYPSLREVINFIFSAKKKDQTSSVSNFFFPFGKNNYLQVFVGQLLGNSLLKLIHQARLMCMCGEKRVGALRPRSSVC
jgi:hypothetical protein